MKPQLHPRTESICMIMAQDLGRGPAIKIGG